MIVPFHATSETIAREIPGLPEWEIERFLAALVASQSDASDAIWSTCDVYVGLDARLRDAIHGSYAGVRLSERRRTHRPVSEHLRDVVRRYVDAVIPLCSRARSVKLTAGDRDRIMAAAELAARWTAHRGGDTLVRVETVSLYYRGFDVARHAPLAEGRTAALSVNPADTWLAASWILARVSRGARAAFDVLAHPGSATAGEIATRAGMTPEAIRLALADLERIGIVDREGHVMLSADGARIAALLRPPELVRLSIEPRTVSHESAEDLVV